MPKFANRVRFTTSTTGTGTITVLAAVAGYRAPASSTRIADGDVVRLWIENGTEWEESLATLGASKTTLTRTLSIARRARFSICRGHRSASLTRASVTSSAAGAGR